MSTLERFSRQKLENLATRGLKRELYPSARGARSGITRADRNLISFCCNDYLGLSQHPAVIAAMVNATRQFGASAGASRLVTGNHTLYEALETEIADFKGTEACCVFGSGYLTNIGVIPCFCGPEDLIIADELCHACQFAGAHLAGSTIITYKHNDLNDLAAQLGEHRLQHERCLIITESVFSMDGDLAPLEAIAEQAQQSDSWLMIDDAHALGILNQGRGSGHDLALRPESLLIMGTLSKAVGAYGGYVCATGPVIEFIKSRARSLIYSTGLPPGVVAAARAAFRIIRDTPALSQMALDRARLFCELTGLPESQSSIVPIIIGQPADAMAASAALEEQGFLVTAIRPPTVPPGTSRLRFTFSAAQLEGDVERLALFCRRYTELG